MNLDLAIQLHRTGDLVGAERGYRALISQRHRNVDIYNNLALICLSTNRVDEGIQLLKYSVEISPNNSQAHLNLGVAYQGLGSLEAAIACYHQALKLHPAYPEAHNNLGIIYAEQGKWEQAVAAYKLAVALKPDFPEAHFNLGNAYNRQRNLDAALSSFQKAVKLKPDYLWAHINLGNTLQDLRRWDEAVACYKAALEINPDLADAHNNMGNALKAGGDQDGAITCFRRALELSPGHGQAHINLALTLADRGLLEEAAGTYKKALAINPNQPYAHFGMGIAFQRQGRLEEAISCFEKTVALNPALAEVHNELGILYSEQGKIESAISAYKRAIASNPGLAQAHYNLGNSLRSLNNYEEAIACYRKSVEVNPHYLLGYLNMGNALQETGDCASSLACYQKVLELDPSYAEAHNNLGASYRELGELDKAISCFKKALKLKPGYDNAYHNQALALEVMGRWNEAVDCHRKALEAATASLRLGSYFVELANSLIELGRMPVIYNSPSEVEDSRKHFIDSLARATTMIAERKQEFSGDEMKLLKRILFRLNNFYLVYQQRNDKDIQAAYCRLATEVLGSELKPYLAAANGASNDGKIRVGIASENLKRHNGASWAYGWLSNLPADDYEFFAYFINGKAPDDLTQQFAKLGTFRALPFYEHNYLKALDQIKQDKLDVLLIPDVGMTGSSKIISLTRLAPIQCVGWGHPVTTGSEQIDYYLSGELMETDGSDEHYTEQLIRLPNTGVHLDYPLLPTETADRSEFGIPKNKIIYGAVQSLFKYLPQYDHVYPAIAKENPNALFVFVGGNSEFVTGAFSRRLSACFEQAGLSYRKHVKILSPMPLSRFFQLLGTLDVYLDSIGFSGGITAMRALALDRPVVTLPGEFMRGRLAYSMLKKIGMDELAAQSEEKYISLAVELGINKDLRKAATEKIKANKHALFNDLQCVDHLDKFLKSEVERVRRG